MRNIDRIATDMELERAFNHIHKRYNFNLPWFLELEKILDSDDLAELESYFDKPSFKNISKDRAYPDGIYKEAFQSSANVQGYIGGRHRPRVRNRCPYIIII